MMNSLIFKHGSLNFILGLTWKTFFYETSIQKKRKLKDFKSNNSNSHGVFIENKDSFSYGIVDKKLSKKTLSLAFLISKKYPNSVHVHKIDDLFWFCWIKKGSPVKDGERFFDDINEFKLYLSNVVIPLSGNFVFYGDRTLVDSSIGVDFIDHDLSTTINSLKLNERKAKVSRFFISRNIKLLTAFFLFLIPTSLFIYDDFLNDRKLSEEATKKIERNANKLVKKFKDSKRKFYSKIYDFSNKPEAGVWTKSIIRKIGDKPTIFKGWVISSINCLALESVCSITYKSSGSGTNVNFFKVFKEEKIDFSSSGNTALVEFDIPFVNKDKSLSETFYLSLPSKNKFHTEVLSKIQYLQGSKKFKYSVTDGHDYYAIENKDKSLPVVDVIIKEWSIKGTGFYYLVEIANELEPNAFFIDSIDVEFSSDGLSLNDSKWTMVGKYAHKS